MFIEKRISLPLKRSTSFNLKAKETTGDIGPSN
jgi:DUF4097 and DUF4098 domain-containing protein YvlB